MTSRSELSGVKIHSKVNDVRVNVIGNQPSMPRSVDFIPLGIIDEYDFVIHAYRFERRRYNKFNGIQGLRKIQAIFFHRFLWNMRRLSFPAPPPPRFLERNIYVNEGGGGVTEIFYPSIPHECFHKMESYVHLTRLVDMIIGAPHDMYRGRPYRPLFFG